MGSRQRIRISPEALDKPAPRLKRQNASASSVTIDRALTDENLLGAGTRSVRW
jgi:hypothetical protein